MLFLNFVRSLRAIVRDGPQVAKARRCYPSTPSVMNEALEPKAKPRGRGRPRKYATAIEKANADVKRKRAKRQQDVSAQWDERFITLYSPSLSSVLPPLPQNNGENLPSQAGIAINPGLRQSPVDNHGDDVFSPEDISQYLAPPSPPLLPSARDSIIENDTLSGNLGVSPGGVEQDDGNDVVAPPVSGIAVEEEEGQPFASERGNESLQPSVDRLASLLTDQLVGFRGCCDDCHSLAKTQHYQGAREHISLSAYLDSTAGLCPDILGDARIAPAGDDLAGKSDASSLS